jgi:hypothetical protein
MNFKERAWALYYNFRYHIIFNIRFYILRTFHRIGVQIMRFWNFIKRFKRFWRSFLMAVLFGLLLWYENYTGTYKTSHTYLLSAIYVVTMLFWHIKKFRIWFKWIIDFLGLEKILTATGFFRFYFCLIGAFIISIYLLGSKDIVIPPGLQFSIIPVTATLGGLVIAGSNNSKLSPVSRNELLRVAQNLIVATISFIFFVATFALANISKDFDPNVLPTTDVEWVKFCFYWLSVVFFFIGTALFVVGITDLSLGLKRIKNELSNKR